MTSIATRARPGLQPPPPHGVVLLLTPTGHLSTPLTTAPHARLIPCQCCRVNMPTKNGAVTATHAPKQRRLPHPHPLALTSTLRRRAVLQTPCHPSHATSPLPSHATLPLPSSLLCAISPTLVRALPRPLDTWRYSPSPFRAISAVSPTLACALPLALTSAIMPSKEHPCPRATRPLLPVLPSCPPWHARPHVPLARSLTHTTIA